MSLEVFNTFLESNPEIVEKVKACANHGEVVAIAKANGIDVSPAELLRSAAKHLASNPDVLDKAKACRTHAEIEAFANERKIAVELLTEAIAKVKACSNHSDIASIAKRNDMEIIPTELKCGGSRLTCGMMMMHLKLSLVDRGRAPEKIFSSKRMKT